MLILQQTSTDPYFNIATEEYLLKNSTEDYFIVYRNRPSIIVGKHQNTIAEINLEFVKQNEIAVVRRLSGGGTVYHDLGNLNYTFIANGSEGNMVDFKKYTQPIIDVMKGLGVDAQIGGKNDIRVGDKKISGNAEHIFKNRVLHHGTLLFDSNLDTLNQAITIDPDTYNDKAVKSIRSHVANISEYLKMGMSIEEFVDTILNRIKDQFPNSGEYELTNHDIGSINKLVNDKYSTWEWSYGYSPTYSLNKRIILEGWTLAIVIDVEKGIIGNIAFRGDGINSKRAAELEQHLKGCPHDIDEVSIKLNSIDLAKYIPEISSKQLLEGLF
jgi:lipoate---protein ligase